MTEIIVTQPEIRTVEILQDGPQGPQGPQGIQGETGPVGPPSAPLSDAEPADATTAEPGQAGTSLEVSRADHVHHIRVAPLYPMLYRFQTGGTPPTQQGRTSGNSATPGASTIAYITYQEDGGQVSLAPRLRLIEAGTVLYYQDRTDETKWARWLVTGPAVDVPASRRVEIPVQFLNASAVGITDQFLAIFLLA